MLLDKRHQGCFSAFWKARISNTITQALQIVRLAHLDEHGHAIASMPPAGDAIDAWVIKPHRCRRSAADGKAGCFFVPKARYAVDRMIGSAVEERDLLTGRDLNETGFAACSSSTSMISPSREIRSRCGASSIFEAPASPREHKSSGSMAFGTDKAERTASHSAVTA